MDKTATEAIQHAIGLNINKNSVGKTEEKYFNEIFDDGNINNQNNNQNNAILNHFNDPNDSNSFIPSEAMNYSVSNYENIDETTNNFLEHFIPQTSTEKYPIYAQGLRHCEGQKQRHGKSLELRCHLIDLDEVNPIDVLTLKRFVTDDGEIIHKKITGLCAKCQRKISKTIKQSRNMGMMPHLGQFVIKDAKPELKQTNFHDSIVVSTNADPVTGKTQQTVKQIFSKTIIN